MNVNNYPRGSEWRKWDLHFHTPSSYDYKDKSVTNEKIIEVLKENNISLVAVTDHHVIDVERITELQNLAGNDIKILTGIECCSDSRGKEPIHFIGIFPETKPESLKYIRDEILAKTNINEQKQNKRVDSEIYCSLEKATKLIRELGGIVTIHAGKKSNSLENITNSLPSSMAQKKDITKNIDIFEMGREEDQKDYIDVVFKEIGTYPMIICSDNHDINDYSLKQNCWIKANPTFEGFKQVLNEPIDRVYIGIRPPKLLEVEGNKSKYIESIKINQSTGNAGGWFDNVLLLNSGLVAVIGRKGTGKSALTDIISLCSNSKVEPKDYSFLNKGKFRKPGLAENYEAMVKWLDGKANEKVNLNSEVNTVTEVEKVKYLPQKFVERICDETGVSTLFQREIEKVIFAYVPEENRLEALTLDDLITIKTQPVKEKITNLRSELNSVNERIVKLENKQRKDYLTGLTKKLDEKKRELNALTQPKEVKKPKSTLSTADQAKLDKITKQLEEIENKTLEAKNSLKDVNNKISKLINIKSAIAQLQDKHDELIKKIKADANLLSIDLFDLIKLTIKDAVLIQKEDALAKEKDKLDTLLEQNNADSKVSLYTKKAKLQTEKEKITKAFTAEQKIYDDYQEQVRQFKLKQKGIEGTEAEVRRIDKHIASGRESSCPSHCRFGPKAG
jgi:hypothetical protein